MIICGVDMGFNKEVNKADCEEESKEEQRKKLDCERKEPRGVEKGL